jgi:mannose-6-phosphate isomerase-like protein (cupin superfamily)
VVALLKKNAGLFSGGLPTGGQWLVLGADEFDDKAERIYAGVLRGGESLPVHSHPADVEEAHILLDRSWVLGGGEERLVERPSLSMAFCGCCHGLANRGTDPLRYFRVAMGAVEEASAIPGDGERGPTLAPLDTTMLDEFWAHDGLGKIRFRRLWDHDSFGTRWCFVDHCVVPPQTSVGYHRHDTVQECYVILSGEGVMKVDGAVGKVVPGDCIPNRLGGSHGLVNGGSTPLEFINLCLAVRKGEWDATNLGDDLSDLI